MTVLFGLVLLLACIVPYVSVKTVSFFSFLSLAVPVLVVINVFFCIYWLLKWHRLSIVSLFFLMVGYMVLGSFVQFRKAEKGTLKEDLSIMTYNSFYFQGLKGSDEKENGLNIVAFIKEKNPDIVCFQEFDHKRIKSKEFNMYPYSYIDFEFGEYKKKVIQAVYSKYPILSSGSLDFPNSANNAIYADILYKKDTVRIYNIHLQSLSVRLGSLKREASDKLYNRLSKLFAKQEEQARLVLDHQKEVDYKKIICGDFNNTQYSNVYRMLKGDKQDTFMEKGSGYDRTYNFYNLFPLRIDFILADSDFSVKSHEKFNVKYSDHFPVMASFSLD